MDSSSSISSRVSFAPSTLNLESLDKQQEEHVSRLQAVFNKSSRTEAKVIYGRMVKFAAECNVSTDTMIKRIEKGHTIAKMIASGNLDPPHRTEDLINVDWFMRAHMAKMNCLYLKGAVKFPDPQNKFLTFIANTQSTYHGHEEESFGRLSSHWPEHEDAINKMPLQLTDGSWVCFNKDQVEMLRKSGVSASNIKKNFDYPAIGIDALGPDGEPNMGVAGKNNTTFLIISFPEKDANNKYVQTIGMKTEGFSAVPIDKANYGKLHQRIGSNLDHGLQFLKKKGPEFLREKVTDAQTYVDKKEDALSSEISELLGEITLLPGKEKGSPEEQALHASYKKLKNSKKTGSNYSLPLLKNHLENMLPILAARKITLTSAYSKSEDKSQLEELKNVEHERRTIHALLQKIVGQEKQSQLMTNDWSQKLVHRSDEVILPTIDEMVDDKVPFKS